MCIRDRDALGAGALFALTDSISRHKNIDFPGHRHAWLYDVGKVSGVLERTLAESGVHIVYGSRIIKAEIDKERLKAVISAEGTRYEGKVFVDATGTAGPMGECARYGNGCAACVLRCPVFGGRVSLCSLAGVKEKAGRREDGGTGAMSGSCKLMKESLSAGIQKELEEAGAALVPVPDSLREDHLSAKACQQYALPEFARQLVLLDTGHAKLMAPWYPLRKLRCIPGMENARFEDPYAGGKGNSIRFLAMAPRENTLQVKERPNLFCAGEKAGPMVGHTEAIVTGTLAGFNAVDVYKRQHLLDQYNDGRKKTLFCLAVNLLESDELEAIVKRADSETSEMPRKEKAAFVSALLQQHASDNGFELKLKKDVYKRQR